METVIYRIVQESLTNAAKYSESKTVIVRLEVEKHTIKIEVEDSGRGFNPELDMKAGFGLMGLEERSLSLGGEFQVKSKPGVGTTVTARFPLDEPCAKDEEDG